MTNNNNKNWPKLLLRYGLLLIFICLLLYYYREAYQGFRDAVRFFSNRDKLSDFVASFGYFAPLTFIGLQIFQVIFAPIPGELSGFIGGYLFGIGPGLVYSTIGLTIGSLSNFLISRRLGLPFVRRFVGQELMAKFDYLMEHQGAFFAFIFFLIPGMPKDYFCYLLGLSPMHIITFFVVSFVGRIPGTLLLNLQGQAVKSEDYRRFFVVLGIALFLIVLTVV
ncbi:MAG: VTT domain-containing protein, partial [Thermodesulfobacteriota bacterium]|nr:VTT domain-containing protein [Thermodesulfobacteriota bacterium]